MAQRPPSPPQSSAEPSRVSATTSIDAAGKARPVGEVAPVDPTSRIGNVAPSEAVSPTAPAAPVGKAAAATAPDRVASIADRLRRGALSPSQAVEELVEDAVQRNLPGLQADSPLLHELRALLKAYAQDDPYLASRISRLGIQR